MGIFKLPDGYCEIKRVKIQEDKKLSLKLNAVVLVFAALLFGIGLIFYPFSLKLFKVTDNMAINRIVIVLLGIAYLPIHELIHGIVAAIITGKRANYGFTGIYAYAGTDAYLNKVQHLIYGISPVIILGSVFLIFNILLPAEYFWTIYIFQILNLASSVGDYYLALLTVKMPGDVLIQNKGISVTLYSHTK